MKSSIYLPRFPGFYNSILSDMIDSTQIQAVENAIECDQLPPEATTEDLEKIYGDFDYKKIHHELGLEFLIYFKHELQNGLKNATSLEFCDYKGIISPREYNFGTDELECEINYDPEKVTDYLIANREAFSQYILDKNTSYDGFMAFFPNDFDEYISNDLEPGQLTQVIDFYIEQQDNDTLIEDIVSQCEVQLFFTPTDEQIQKEISLRDELHTHLKQ